MDDRSPNSPYADPLPECPECGNEMNDCNPDDVRTIFWPDERVICSDCYWHIVNHDHNCIQCGGDLTPLHDLGMDDEECIDCQHEEALEMNRKRARSILSVALAAALVEVAGGTR